MQNFGNTCFQLSMIFVKKILFILCVACSPPPHFAQSSTLHNLHLTQVFFSVNTLFNILQQVGKTGLRGCMHLLGQIIFLSPPLQTLALKENFLLFFPSCSQIAKSMLPETLFWSEGEKLMSFQLCIFFLQVYQWSSPSLPLMSLRLDMRNVCSAPNNPIHISANLCWTDILDLWWPNGSSQGLFGVLPPPRFIFLLAHPIGEFLPVP